MLNTFPGWKVKYIKKPSNQFLKEYKLPLSASFAFIIILVALLAGRAINRIALIDVLGKNSNNNYSELLSSDKKDDFKKNETTGENNSTEKTSTPTTITINPSFTVTPNPAPPPTQTDPEQNTPQPNPSPFTASILGFGLYKTEYEYCSSGSGGTSMAYRCFKKYFYKARIKTSNGPGAVNYSWEGNFEVINSSGSFSVSSVEAYTDISKDFKLACNDEPEEIQIKLILTEPNFTEAPQQEHIHDCTLP